MSNYKTIKENIHGALRDGEFELAALQARFSIQIGIRTVVADRGLSGHRGSPFEVLRSTFSVDDHIRVLAMHLDRCNPMSQREVVDYCTACQSFVEKDCGLTGGEYLASFSGDEQVEATIKTMEQLTSMAEHLKVELPWPAADIVMLRLLRDRITRFCGIGAPKSSIASEARTR